jgi:glc operon protein GlcG
MLATVFCLSVGAQTVSVLVLDQAGAQPVLQAAKESAQQRNGPCGLNMENDTGIANIAAAALSPSPKRSRE